MNLFQTLALMAQRVMQEGQQQAAGHLLAIQQLMLEHSSFGKELNEKQNQQNAAIELVAQRLEKLGEDMTRSDLIAMVIEFADDEDKIEAVVGLVRPALDYEFFLEFSEQISKAPAAQRDKLENVRDTVRDLTEEVDQQTRQMVQQKAQFLRMLLSTENFEAMLRENIALIDDSFMSVLSANIQEAQRRQDLEVTAKLRRIYEATVQILQSQMTPELRFINELLSAENAEDMQKLIDDRAEDFGDALLEAVDAVEQLFQAQGQADAVKQLDTIRESLKKVLS
jgi:hypothetical protein